MLFSQMPDWQLKALIDGEAPNPNWQPESVAEIGSRFIRTTKQQNRKARKQKVRLTKAGKRLWRELFLEVESEEQLTDWEKKIPSYGCSCKRFYRDWKITNPPDFPLRLEWKWKLKSAVNHKLGHKDLTLDAAREFWSAQAGNAEAFPRK